MVLTLRCFLVDAYGALASSRFFAMQIDERASVDELKAAIKKTLQQGMQFRFPARYLRLYVARTADGEWIPSVDKNGAVAEPRWGNRELDVQNVQSRWDKDLEMQPMHNVSEYLCPKVDVDDTGESFFQDLPPESVHVIVENLGRGGYFPLDDLDHRRQSSLPFFPRDMLVSKLYSAIIGSREPFVLVHVPPGAGKSLLLTLFAFRFPDFRCIRISLRGQRAKSLADILADYGIDIDSRSTIALRGDTVYVIMLDDTDETFDDIWSWGRLMANNVRSWASNLLFVVSITRDPITMGGWFGGMFCGL